MCDQRDYGKLPMARKCQKYVRFHLEAGARRLGRVPVVSHVGTHSSLPGEGPIVRRIIVCDVLGIFWGEMD